jgi:hypothetical protein
MYKASFSAIVSESRVSTTFLHQSGSQTDLSGDKADAR